MADQDFSHRTVSQKLGINPGDQITILNPPENYLKLLNLPSLQCSNSLEYSSQMIHYFAHSQAELKKDFPNLKNHLARDGILWISNKKGNKDFNQNDVQQIGLENGLVDIKVASLNNEWSAMKFVYRRTSR